MFPTRLKVEPCFWRCSAMLEGSTFLSKGLSMRKRLVFSLILPCLTLSSSAFAAAYYVAQAGSDSNPGTKDRPWRTISKANAALVAGDTVYVGRGTYTSGINPANSGTGTSSIVYRNLPGDLPLVKVSGGEPNILISSKHHIVVDGFQIANDTPPNGVSFNVDIRNSRNITLRNTRVIGAPTISQVLNQHNAGIKEGGIRISGGSDNRLENNLIQKFSFHGIKFSERTLRNTARKNIVRDNLGDAIRIDTAFSVKQGHLIEGNRLSGSLASDGIQTNGDFNAPDRSLETSNQGIIIRNNIIFGNGENGLDLKGSRYFLIEGNTIFGNISDNDGSTDGANSRGNPGGIGKGSKAASQDIIIRDNILYDSNVGAFATHGWKIYNNTIVGNNRDYTGPDSKYAPSGQPWFVGVSDGGWQMKKYTKKAAIKNNIIANHKAAEIRLQSASEFDIDHNLYFNARNEARMAIQEPGGWVTYKLRDWQMVLRGYPGFTGFDDNSVVTDPGFVGAPDYPVNEVSRLDFSLRPTSPAIDAGGPLTRTANSGSGKRIAVLDAGYFFDGFGVTTGDLIVIGSSSPVRVTRVDFANNVLDVARSISWAKNESVSRPYSGKAPDIGAMEFSDSSGPDSPKAPLLL